MSQGDCGQKSSDLLLSRSSARDPIHHPRSAFCPSVGASRICSGSWAAASVGGSHRRWLCHRFQVRHFYSREPPCMWSIQMARRVVYCLNLIRTCPPEMQLGKQCINNSVLWFRPLRNASDGPLAKFSSCSFINIRLNSKQKARFAAMLQLFTMKMYMIHNNHRNTNVHPSLIRGHRLPVLLWFPWVLEWSQGF